MSLDARCVGVRVFHGIAVRVFLSFVRSLLGLLFLHARVSNFFCLVILFGLHIKNSDGKRIQCPLLRFPHAILN